MLTDFAGTDDDYLRYVALKRSVWPHEPLTVAAQRSSDSLRDPDEIHHRVLAREGDDVVAAIDYYSLPFSADPGRFGFMVIVRPDRRRKGHATALYRHLLDDPRLVSATALETAAYEAEPSGQAWLERRGFELRSRHQMSELDTGSFDPARFAATVSRVEESGVELTTLADFMARDVDAARRMYDLAIELSADVPWYEKVRKPPLDVWRVEFLDAPNVLRGAFVVAVVDGEPIGQSALYGDEASPTLLHTGLTGVQRRFRRRGIATAMKVVAIEHAGTLGDAIGSPARIRTGNASENPMLDLNLRLGFVRQPAWLIFTTELRPDA